MRLKSPKRRQAIIEAAAAMFRERGFDRASMHAIAARVGGSKGTLYSYFPSKEELFFAVVEDALESQATAPFDALGGRGDLHARLEQFARLYVEFRLGDDVIALDRMLIAESERTNLAGIMHERYVQPQWRRPAEALKAEMDAGRLRAGDPYRAATQFRLLAEGDLVERRLRGDRSVSSEMAAGEVTKGLEAFLRAYAPEAEADRRGVA